MNTPAHLLLNLAVLQSSRLAGGPNSQGMERATPHAGAWIAGGALLPDLPMFGFFLWQTVIIDMPQQTIWSEAYFRESWQLFFNLFNSIPLAVAGLGICMHQRWRGPGLLFLSVLMHCALDLPLHHDDGHAHFLPLSSWQFESPISYWDPRHFGWIGAGFETAIVLASCVQLWGRSRKRWPRALLVGLGLLSLVGYSAAHVFRSVPF